jgi:hypothetical protein
MTSITRIVFIQLRIKTPLASSPSLDDKTLCKQKEIEGSKEEKHWVYDHHHLALYNKQAMCKKQHQK